ncbi:glycosyltransferase family 2 protein [Aliirhizobium terrae]|uniref:glycosyltransferase family 2 protein n=1 Tax=Terrirhizobium terrae TaxID=2926709 RepID=UPI0025757C79|nr:glycosyltransferase family 2 protein [Rhizobium sp. CC-CFT758]WJH39670.1 glycosyltransferase family 2 protein [Rhizobium sp. CC-CFT758]
MTKVAVLILTHNEQKHIGRAIRSVRAFASEVFVVDSFSKDRTVEVAEEAGAVVLQNPWTNYSKQFQWGLENAPITADWIMRLDADEIIEDDLAATIQATLPALGADVAGINIKRKHIFWDRWIRHGGRYPLVLLRLWRRGQGRIEDRWMDEHIVVWGGRTITLEGGFSDCNLNDLTFFTAKHNGYATREAIDVLNQKYKLFERDQDLSSDSASKQAAIKRWFKEKVYNRLPFWVGPLGYFLYRYIFQLGFLDGRPGLVYHFLQGFWYRFLVGAKIVEFDRTLQLLPNRDERLRALEAMTGHKLS